MKTRLFRALLLGATVLAMSAHPAWATTNNSSDSNADAVELVDPTQPNWFGIKKAKKKYSNTPKLNSLVNGAGRRLAVINGLLMREGDTKEGITLHEIKETSVVITTRSGKNRELRLTKTKGLAQNSHANHTQEAAREGNR